MPRLLTRCARASFTWLLPLSLAACTGDIGAGVPEGQPPGEQPEPAPAEYAPSAPVLPRLTATQYRASVADLLGPDLPEMTLEDDTQPYLFYSIGASTTTLSELGTQLYEEAADAATHAAFADKLRRVVIVGCEPRDASDPCIESFVERFGRRAFRRPLDQKEKARWVDVVTTLGATDVWEGLRLAAAGMLQSPNFIYRVELGAPDPTAPGFRRLDGFEMASRISFLLTDRGPDDALLDAAERGELETPEGLQKAAARLFDSPRARETLGAFFAQYLDLGRLRDVDRDPALYPASTPTLAASMRREIELLVDDLVFENPGDMRQLFTTRETFVNAELAALYGIAAPGATADTFVRVSLDPAGPRRGILTLGGFLAMNAQETHTSPTARGKYLRERVLCQTVPAPPANANTNLPPPAPGEPPKTVREQVQQHLRDPACAACHTFIDPPGLVFENFDSIGAYRELEAGLPIDASGDLDGIPLQNASDLTEALAEDERVPRCMIQQFYRHALARVDSGNDTRAIDDVTDTFAATGYDFRSAVLTLVAHDGFRRVTEPEGK